MTVVTGDRGYDDPSTRFQRYERWKGITIHRVPSLSLGKNSRWRRVVTFASFIVTCTLRLLALKRFDVVVALTSPPLISFLAALFVKLKGGRFCFWVMDLNPDEAIAAGWLDKNSSLAKLLQWMLRYSLKTAHCTVVLDRFMAERVLAKGIDTERVVVVPPWAHDDAVQYSPEGREAFRAAHELSGQVRCDVLRQSQSLSSARHTARRRPRAQNQRRCHFLFHRRRERTREGARVRSETRLEQRQVFALSTAGPTFEFFIGGRHARGRDGRSVCRHRSSRARSTTSCRSARRFFTSDQNPVTSRTWQVIDFCQRVMATSPVSSRTSSMRGKTSAARRTHSRSTFCYPS